MDATTSSTASARSRNPLAFLDAEIEELKAKGIFRRLRVVQSEQKSRCVIDGREVITLSSNNYLGLNTHPRLRMAAIEAVERYGAGSGAVAARDTIVAAESWPVTFAAVRNMSGMVSTPSSTPRLSTGTPAEYKTGAITMIAPAGTPGTVKVVSTTVATIVASCGASSGTP